jgi:hypothetical protein
MTEVRVSRGRVFTVSKEDGDLVWISMGGVGITAGGMYTRDDIVSLVGTLAETVGVVL